jgi:transposase
LASRIDLDFNIIERSAPDAQERAFRPPRQRRGSWAIVASLTETCKLNGINPYVDLADVLSRPVNLRPPASTNFSP